MRQPQVAVVLSGCGVLDGSEITESVALLIALSQQGFAYTFFAPDRKARTINHLTGQATRDEHAILTESARIARGAIYPIGQLDMTHFTALAFPGGVGVLQHLCNFNEAGQQAVLLDDIQKPLRQTLNQQKPVVALCAAPMLQALAAKMMGWTGASLTLGSAKTHAPLVEALVAWGQRHVEKPVNQACIDATHGFISAPAYMFATATPADILASCTAAVTGLQSLLSS